MKTVLEFLDGKKTIVAAVAGVVLTWVAGRDLLAPDTITMLSSLLTIWTGIAVTHKVVKGELKKKD